jgi:hypothetical protein
MRGASALPCKGWVGMVLILLVLILLVIPA